MVTEVNDGDDGFDIPAVLNEATYEDIFHRLIHWIRLLMIWIIEDNTLSFQGLYFTVVRVFPQNIVSAKDDVKVEPSFVDETERKYQIISYGFNRDILITECFIRNLLQLYREKKGDKEVKAIFNIFQQDMYFMKRDSAHMIQ